MEEYLQYMKTLRSQMNGTIFLFDFDFMWRLFVVSVDFFSGFDSIEVRCGGSRCKSFRRGTDADYHNQDLGDRSRSWLVFSLSMFLDSKASVYMYGY